MNIKVVKNKKRLGLGYALSRGFKISKNPFVMFIDADLSIKKNDIIKLYNCREKTYNHRFKIFETLKNIWC